MKKFFNVQSKCGKDYKEFPIYTNKAHSVRIAEQVAKNHFYQDNVIIINIELLM